MNDNTSRTERPAAGRHISPALLVRGLVRALDVLLRRCYGVYEFTTDPACILRVALVRARTAEVLADGTRIEPGDVLIAPHLWNERLPRMPREGADLLWARQMYRGFTVSLRLLAKYSELDPGLDSARAVWAEPGFATSTGLDGGLGALARLGFEIRRPRARAGPWRRFAEFWENLYSYALLWTFNPGSMRRKTLLRLERFDLWMSRATLERRFGRGAGRGDGRGIGDWGLGQGADAAGRVRRRTSNVKRGGANGAFDWRGGADAGEDPGRSRAGAGPGLGPATRAGRGPAAGGPHPAGGR